MRISFEIDTAEDFEKVRKYFLSGKFATGEEREEEGVSPLSPPLPFPPITPYPITPFNSPSFQEEEREEEHTKSRARGQLQRYGEFVRLTDDEFQKLADKFGEMRAYEMIEHMNWYIAEDPKRQKKYEKRNHYMTLLNWARKDEKEGKTKQSYSFRDIVEMGA